LADAGAVSNFYTETIMQVDSISQAVSPQPYQVGGSGGNEAVERTPDNEAAEVTAVAPDMAAASEIYSLAPWQGTVVDVTA